MSYVSSLKLHNFRCYKQITLSDLSPGMVVLHGPNGAGKTNILEALSILSPGRGLRAAHVMEMQCRDAGTAWAVSAGVTNPSSTSQIGTGLDASSNKRTIRINGETVKAQSALADYVSCVWLTPQMDRLFLDSSRERRRFFDRLVFAFDPGHAGRITRYDNAMGQRSRLLKEGGASSWIEGLEAQMAETGTAIAAARLDFTQRLQAACEKAQSKFFPLARLEAAGTLEELLQTVPALEVENMFRYQLQESRGCDAETGGAASGPHKSDLLVRYAAKDMAADQCSTGEQKALLIGIILAHARMIAAERGAPPILLLDEIAAHLDEGRRAALYDLLEGLGAQVWLTGTDESLFTAIEGRAQFFHVENAKITPQSFAAPVSRNSSAA
jgi:DNA replication and repair protein RecF